MITAPFGVPVLPEVKLMSAGALGAMGARTARPDPRFRARSAALSTSVSGSSVAEALRAPGVAASRYASSASTRRGFSSAIWASSSCALRR